MKINEFIEGFNAAENKEKFVNKHIKTDYVVYATKIATCQRIVQACMYDEDGRFAPNTPMRYMLFVVSIIELYTDIEFDATDKLSGFDDLEACGADNYIVNAVASDFSKFESVMNMTVDDAVDRSRNLIDYFDGKIARVKDALAQINPEELQATIANGEAEGK